MLTTTMKPLALMAIGIGWCVPARDQTRTGGYTSPPLYFAFGTLAEEQNFLRFGEMNGYSLIVASTGSIDIVEFPFEMKSRERFLKRYKDEFGVDFRNAQNFEVKTAFPTMTVVPSSSVTVAEFRKSCDVASLLGEAIDRAEKSGDLLGSDKVKSVEYVIRPWISRDLKRTEIATGSISVLRNGLQVKVQL